jgi:hypothetical protein
MDEHLDDRDDGQRHEQNDDEEAQVAREEVTRENTHERSLALQYIAGSEAIGQKLTRPVLSIGNFDGIHLGHRAILDTVVERSHALEGEAVVYTFDPHPRKVLRPERAPHSRADPAARGLCGL